MNGHINRRRFLQTLSVLSVAPSVLYGSGSAEQAMPQIGYLGGAGVLALENVFNDEMADGSHKGY